MKIYSIYRIYNKKNNKSYIGFTKDLEIRWKNHLTGMKFVKRPLYESMRMHGPESFNFEVIYQSKNREHTLIEMEPFFIELYNSYNKGYNCNKGGLNTNTDKLRKLNSERMKLNNPMKKLRHNNGTFKKGQKPKITKERNEKIRLSKLGKKNHNYGNSMAAAPLNVLILCEYCNKHINKGNYHRWHGEKCKLNSQT